MKVTVHRGDWADQTIRGKEFELFRGLSMGQRGPFITVNGAGTTQDNGKPFPARNFKVYVKDLSDFTVEDGDAFYNNDRNRAIFRSSPDPALRNFIHGENLIDQVEAASHAIPASAREPETDEQIRDRIAERFQILGNLTLDVARGNIKGLVVSGASGVGKSFEVEAALNRDSLIDKLSFNADATDQDSRRMTRERDFKPRYNIVKGYSTAPALYATLYDYSESRETLVFDDCDSVLGDETSLNLLKAALDTSGRRMISWRSNSKNGSDAPNQFEFKGSVIFITNINFERIVEKGTARLAPHLEAIMSRCLYLDLTIDNVREKLCRIDYVARDLRMLEKEFKLEPVEVDEVLEWTHTHARRFRELSLRKIGQLASLRKGQRDWRRIADITLLRQR